ncbi:MULTISPECIES: COG1470 family protein [unclassified Saccharothrix]|uniref:COG1470 family protein n=1 Tax=unclassified Saccharothrix TaxID=2593673 RepID=UPI00307F3CCA
MREHGRRLWAATAAVVLAVGLTTAVAAPAQAAPSPYPFPLPDFSHTSTPHAPLFKPRTEGLTPLLVVYGTFTDLTNVTETVIEDKFFSIFEFGTVADYYLTHGFTVLVPVVESSGIADNGVITVDLGKSADALALDPAQRRRKMVDLADQFIDFARYDRDKDGTVEDTELSVATVFTSRPGTDNCGQAREVAAGNKLDGKTIGFRTGDGGTATNVITFAHELAHQTYDLFDHYGYGVGSWDIAGPTCTSGEVWFEPNPWHKMHIGTEKPQIVTSDGYVVISNDSRIRQSYLLYDPGRGTEDYFLVEARTPRANTYNQSVPDTGVVIWRIDERNVRSGFEHIRGVEVMRPDGTRAPGCVDEDVDGMANEDPPGGGDSDSDGRTDEDGPDGQLDNDTDGQSNEDPPGGGDSDGDGRTDEDGPDPDTAVCSGGTDTDAWDPTDSRTPKREMDYPWADNTPAKVAVRAIGRPFFNDPGNSEWQQVYFDVAGPGILVDPADANGNAPRPSVALGDSFDLPVAVMNTGEATDTFDFSALLPTGWSAPTQRMTLTAGQRATVTLRITVPQNTGVHPHRIFVRGQSVSDATVRTDYDFLVDVVKRRAGVSYVGDVSVDHSDPATLSAVVTDRSTGAPLSGKTVTFTVSDQVFTATTGADGIAGAQWLATVAPGSYEVRVAVAEDGLHGATGTFGSVTVEPENLTVSVTSPMVQPASGTLVLKALDEQDGYPADLTKAGASITLTPTLTAAPQTYSTTFDAGGNAVVPLGAPVDVWSLAVAVSGDHFTGPGVTGELVLFNPDGAVYGTERGTDTAGATVRLTTSIVYQDTTPVGYVRMDVGTSRFTSDKPQWLVVVGNTAIYQAAGVLNGQPAVVRGKIVDEGNGGATQDRFTVTVGAYSSGEVTARTGNLFVRIG